ncbi:hypothetical protein [Luteolibacter flavescens]|uniref:hypothetical protein n=1 Tax=Luteolibacter flavescens TaxID=1859460 RepID=UPI0022234D95|nr:hypothetical protein [Luteolibacter flavescens]
MFRSLAFWAWVPGLVFLLWLWGKSSQQGFVATWTGSAGSFKFDSVGGALVVTRAPRGSYIDFGTEFWSDGWLTKEPLVPRWWARASVERRPDGMRHWVLPYWLLTAAYLVPWSAAVGWRWRRYRVAGAKVTE